MFNILTVFNIAGDSTLTPGVPEEVAGADVYVVLIVTLIVWIGIFFYLMHLDSKLKQLSKRIAGKKT